MKLTTKTLTILKNFNTINPTICFKPGNMLRTISASQTILAQAKIDVDIDTKFCINDLSRFMSTLSLFNDPELLVDNTYATISDGRSRVRYVLAAEKLILLPPENNLTLDNPSCQFTLTNGDLQQTFKAMSVLGLPEIAVIGDGQDLFLQGIDSDGRVQDDFRMHIGQTSGTYKVIFKTDNIKILPYDYEVRIARVKGTAIVAHFKGKTEEIEYWIAVSKDSKL